MRGASPRTKVDSAPQVVQGTPGSDAGDLLYWDRFDDDPTIATAPRRGQPGSPGAARPPQAGPTGASSGAGPVGSTDPNVLRQHIQYIWQTTHGRPATQAEEDEWVGYMSRPDVDGSGRQFVGIDPYWDSRMRSQAAAWDQPDRGRNWIAPDDYEGQALQARAGGGDGAMTFGQLPPGYEMGTFTGGGSLPLASVMAPGLMQPWTTPFQRPTLSEESDPGYLARMDMGRQAIERSAAARGTLRTGGTLKDLTQFGQDYGSSEYDKIYGRAQGEYQQAYGIYDRNQNNQFNRLYSMANMGQNAAAQMANQGSTYAGRVGDLYTQQGNAGAAGVVGAQNAWNNAVGNMGNLGMALGQYYAGRSGAGASTAVPAPLYRGDAIGGGVNA